MTRNALALTLAVLMGYVLLRGPVMPGRWDLLASLLVVAALTAVARWARLTPGELGMARGRLRAGLVYGTAGFALVLAVIVLVALIPATTELLDDDRVDVPASTMVFEVFVAIPLGTVLLEEFAFRGSLLALLRRSTSTLRAVAISSVLFGLWHVAPILMAPGDAALFSDTPTWAAVASTVAVTTAAGVAFCWLRLRSGSLLAPFIAHWAANGVTFAVAWILIG